MARPPVIDLCGPPYPAPVYALDDYHPSRGKTQNEFSRNILRLKSGSDDALKYFADRIMIRLRLGSIPTGADIVAIVPTTSKGLAELAERVSELSGCRFVVDTLVATEKMRKATGSFDRPEFEERLQSIRVRRRVRGKKILVLDDVITSGATMRAALELLIRAGAGAVTGVALGKTRTGSP